MKIKILELKFGENRISQPYMAITQTLEEKKKLKDNIKHTNKNLKPQEHCIQDIKR